MNAFIKTLTKSQLQDIVSNGISGEIAKHENARQRQANRDAIKDRVVGAKRKVLGIRIRNPFYSK